MMYQTLVDTEVTAGDKPGLPLTTGSLVVWRNKHWTSLVNMTLGNIHEPRSAGPGTGFLNDLPQEVTLAESWRGGRTYLERRRSITRYMFQNQERRLRVRK